MPLVMDIASFLRSKADEYEHPSFIEADPVSIPHLFSSRQDIEIAGLFAALFAWGNRTTIIAKSRELMRLMDNSPFEFCLAHRPSDLKRLLHFKHRTFNPTDILYLVSFLHQHYRSEASLETAFSKWMTPRDTDMTNALNGFYQYVFSLEEVPGRTRKHIAAPFKNASCKRLNMYLRWMVRSPEKGVDFGIWQQIRPAQLMIPLDLHVARVARHFGLLTRKQTDWAAVQEITAAVREIDPDDPARFDFALFGLGVLEKF